MKIYRSKDGGWHRDAKSAGAGAVGLEFDNKTKDGILDLLGRLAPVLPAKGIPAPGPVNAPETPRDDEDQAEPIEGRQRFAGTRWRAHYRSPDGSCLFVGACNAPDRDSARQVISSRLEIREAP